jgi:hypothetical protein
MSTAQSPAWKLEAEADKMAKIIKAVERGEKVAADPAGKMAAALARGSVKFGIVMDDKIITINMPTATIRETDEAGIAAWIIEHMRGNSRTTQ